MGLKGANIGCGSIRPEGWSNYDVEDWDVHFPLHACELKAVETGAAAVHGGDHCAEVTAIYDYAVASFMLQEFDFHELPEAIDHMMAILKPGCWLRILVPDMHQAWAAYWARNREWFPQDERTGGLDAAFCTYLTWFGTSKSVFTPRYLLEVCGEERSRFCHWGMTWSQYPQIMDLDSRQNEALIIEVKA